MGLGIGIGDFGLGFGIVDLDRGLGSEIGIGDWDFALYFILMRIMKFISFLQIILQLVLRLFGGCVVAGLLKNEHQLSLASFSHVPENLNH